MSLRDQIGAQDGFYLFLAPVALSAWWSGLSGGLLSLLASTLLLYPSLPVDGSCEPLLKLFFIASLPVVFFSEARRRALARAEEALARLDELVREKDRTLALLAHELRNPLSSLSNALHLLRQRTPTHRSLDIAERSLQQMGRLIDDIMDVSRISRNRVQLRYQSFDLADLLRTVVPAAAETAAQKGLAFELDAPTPLRVFADPIRISQVVGNLVGNAVKFTDRGAVRVRLNRIEGAVQIVVADTGIGIPMETLPDIFEPFAQQDGHRGGLGLGLSVVKGLVDIHGGTLSVESEPGAGTTFTVELPLEESLLARRASVIPGTDGSRDTGDT